MRAVVGEHKAYEMATWRLCLGDTEKLFGLHDVANSLALGCVILGLKHPRPNATSSYRECFARILFAFSQTPAPTLKVGKLSTDEKLFLAGEQSKHAPAPSTASTSGKSADQTSADALIKFGVVALFALTDAVSYYLVKEMGVVRTFWAILFAGFLTIPIATGAGLLGILAVMKFRQKTTKAGS